MFKLSPEAQRRADEYRAWHTQRCVEFANMSDANLVASTKLFMAHSRPLDVAPGEPVYDATLWHVILPELMRRVGSSAVE